MIAEIYTRFVENPDESSRSFMVKFEDQLEGAPDAPIQLAGELLYFHFLVADDISGAHKRISSSRSSAGRALPSRFRRNLAAP